MAAPKTQTMQRVTVGDRVIRFIFWYRRLERLLFISPAEAKFVEVMRGKAYRVPFIKSSKTGFPLTFLRLGMLLRRELVEREVRVGDRYFFADFATPSSRFLKAIEIDGKQWHRDIVKEQERDEYFRANHYELLRIPAARLWNDPHRAYVDVLKFLRQ